MSFLPCIGMTDFRRPMRTTRCPPCPLSNVHPCFLSQALNCRGVIDECPSVVPTSVNHWFSSCDLFSVGFGSFALALRSWTACARPSLGFWLSWLFAFFVYGRSQILAPDMMQCKHTGCGDVSRAASGASGPPGYRSWPPASPACWRATPPPGRHSTACSPSVDRLIAVGQHRWSVLGAQPRCVIAAADWKSPRQSQTAPIWGSSRVGGEILRFAKVHGGVARVG